MFFSTSNTLRRALQKGSTSDDQQKFWVWLSVLVIPIFILGAIQVDKRSGPSIGGGGYDLGPFLYFWAMVILAVVWSLCTFGAALVYKDQRASLRALSLAAVGIITLLGIVLFYRQNLS